MEDQGGEADEDAEQQGAEEVFAPGRHVDAGQIDDRRGHHEDADGTEQRLTDGVGTDLQVEVNDGGDEEAFYYGEDPEQPGRERVIPLGRCLDPENQPERDDEVEDPGDVLRDDVGPVQGDPDDGEGQRNCQ